MTASEGTAPASIHRIATIDARCEPYDWPWAHENRDAIAEDWARRLEEHPRLFNGTVLLARERRIDGDVLRLRFFPTDYASFLALMEVDEADPCVENAFALGALRSAEGAYVLGVMGAHTANAGKAYFAAGTPDPSDVGSDGVVDLLGSLVRELEEETGLLASDYVVGDGWTLVEAGRTVALFRPLRATNDAATIERRILAHIAQEADPELSGVRLVRGVGDLEDGTMPRYLVAYLRDALARSVSSGSG